MSDQLYWLGEMASRKFRLLNASYKAFRWGLICSVLTFASVKSFQHLLPILDGGAIVRLRNVGISQFEDIYEPSAVQQLPDGRILVVEDESKRAFSIMRFLADGSLAEDAALHVRLVQAFRRKLSDLEGLTMDADGYIYAITSHSRDNKGRRRAEREQLLRFRILGNKVTDLGIYTGLIEDLQRSPLLEQALREHAENPVSLSKINIEGLNFDQKNQRLLIGFREPLVGGKSMIVKVADPARLFEPGHRPSFSQIELLDLQGGGIRSLSYDPILGTFLIVNEISGHEGNLYSQLWSWSGEPSAKPAPDCARPPYPASFATKAGPRDDSCAAGREVRFIADRSST